MFEIVAPSKKTFFVSNSRNPMRFQDFLKFPKLFAKLGKQLSERDAHIALTEQWSDAQLERAIRDCVFESTPGPLVGNADIDVLSSLGERKNRIVLGLLADKSLESALTACPEDVFLAEPPFAIALKLLGDRPPDDAIEAAEHFAQHSDVSLRKNTALLLGKMGSSKSLPLILRALRDEEESVRNFALIGLEYALTRGSVNESTRAALFPVADELIQTNLSSKYAARILFLLDPENATERYLSAEIFRRETEALPAILKIFAEHEILVPREKLLPLIESLESPPVRRSTGRLLGKALHSLGLHRDETDRPFLEQRTRHPEQIIAKGAFAGLLALDGVGNVYERICDLYSKGGTSAFSPVQYRCFAVLNADTEINNGGLNQYYFNSSGDYWKSAIDGLQAMGSIEKRQILQDSVALFGNSGPAENREKRQRQLDKLIRQNEDLFEDLTSSYFKSEEQIVVLVNRYVLANVEDFR